RHPNPRSREATLGRRERTTTSLPTLTAAFACSPPELCAWHVSCVLERREDPHEEAIEVEPPCDSCVRGRCCSPCRSVGRSERSRGPPRRRRQSYARGQRREGQRHVPQPPL